MDVLYYLKYRPKNISELNYSSNRLNINKSCILLNTIISGIDGVGKYTRALILLTNYFEANIISTKNTIEIKTDNYKTIIFSYMRSKYHIEIDTNNMINNQKNIINYFLKDYIQTINIGNMLHKVVIIRHAEKLTKNVQNMLRRLIEIYYKTIRFIFITSSMNNIIGPIRSRFSLIQIKAPNNSIIINIINEISKKENKKITKKNIMKILDHSEIFYNKNLKKIINTYQLSTIGGKFKLYKSDDDNYLLKIYKLFNNKSIDIFIFKSRELLYELLSNNYNMNNIFKIIAKLINNNIDCQKEKIIEEASKINHISCISNKEIVHLESFFIKCYYIINPN